MIKVQPSHSRMQKAETSERITLTMPARGVGGFGGVLILVALLWLMVTVSLIVVALLRGNRDFAMIAAVAMLPAFVALVAGTSAALKSWSVQRDSSKVTLKTRGLLGTSTRHWSTDNVAAFFPQTVPTADPARPEAWLAMGLRNGRSVTLVRDDYEEISWAAAMLRDARGTRKAASPLILAAEPERRRIDPAIVPASLACRTFDDVVEMVFRPLLQVRGRWWRVPLSALGAVAGVLLVAAVAYAGKKNAAVPVVARLFIAGIVGWTGWRLWVLHRSAVLTVADGIVTIKRNHGADLVQFGKVDVEFVQTYRTPGHAELQFLLKGQPKIRLFDGRPAEELEWAARFLRVAIKGAHEPETAAMKVDAAAGDCQVCHEKMDSRVVYCAKCRTPHHEECWSYMGVCSTYGCREIRFERT